MHKQKTTAIAQSDVTQSELTQLWHQKVDELSPMVMRIARGDEDMYQEGILGIRDALLRDPDATDSYLLQGARFAMNNYRNRGKSVDNGSRHPTTKTLLDGTVKVYRKDMRPIPIDILELEYAGCPPDELALDRICADRFYDLLTDDETAFVDASIHCLDGRNSDCRAMGKLNVDRSQYNSLRQSAYRKFISAFGTDDQLEAMK